MIAVLLVVYAIVAIALTGLAATTLAWKLYSWRSDGTLAEVSATDSMVRCADVGGLSFSLIVPARHEEAVLPATLTRLANIEHDNFEILVVVGHDDSATEGVARRAADQHPDRIRVVVDHNATKNKPKALNTALPYCHGDVVAVFDAEDVVHPALLDAAERRMVADGCAALQSGVQLMNFWTSWYAVHNVLEYYFWFRSRLRFQSAQGFIPLGGNTVFVRRQVLVGLGGWDSDCLAEDCDLGVRLSSQGFRVSVVYDPALVTREEAPATLGAFMRQRTRWNQGFLQVLRKRDWALVPNRRRRAFALFTLSSPLLQAVTAPLMPIAVATMVFAKVPVGFALLSFLPLIPTVATGAIDYVALSDFGRLYGHRPMWRDRARLLFGMPVFQAALAVAALRAVCRLLAGRSAWEKTAHLGLHLETDVQVATEGLV